MARHFNSSLSERAVNTASIPVTGNPFSLSVWLKPSTAKVQTAIALNTSDSGGSGYVIAGLLSTGRGFVEADVDRYSPADGDFPVGAWHLMNVVMSDTGVVSVYRDGTLGESLAVAHHAFTHITLGCLDVGGTSPSYVSFFDGDIGEVGIWNAALTGSEVTSLLTATPNNVRTGALVAYYPLNGTSNTTETDDVGNIDLTLEGASAGVDYPTPASTNTPVSTGGSSGVAPSNTVAPHITSDGTPQTGETVSCSTGTWAGDPTITYAYQWKRGTANISSANATTYTLQTADVGQVITCVVIASNGTGTAAQVSDNSVTPTATVPANTVAPLVSGIAWEGHLVSCSTGTWTNGPTSYGYQWTRGGTNISGATSSAYTLVSSDVGTSVLCKVTATNTAGSTTANSNTISPTVPSVSSLIAHVTAIDPVGASFADDEPLTVGTQSGIHSVSESLVGTRLVWGSIIGQGDVVGPSFGDDGHPVILSQFFQLTWACRFIGGRFYKPPTMSGDVEFKLWQVNGTTVNTTGTALATWTLTGLLADNGGWVEFAPSAPIGVDVGNYAVSYLTTQGRYSTSPWIWHAMDWSYPPFYVPMFAESTLGRWNGNAYYDNPPGGAHLYPISHVASNYYIDIDVEWDVNTPRDTRRPNYFNQWINGPRYG